MIAVKKTRRWKYLLLALAITPILAYIRVVMSDASPANEVNGNVAPTISKTTGLADCVPLRPRGRVDQDASILASGRYCVVQDFKQPKLSGAGHRGPSFDHALISVEGGDVVIDLQGHTLSSDYGSRGVLSAALWNKGAAEREVQTFGLETHRIVVKNGTIDLTAKGTQAGVRLIKWWSLDRIDENIPEKLKGYESTQFILENLIIRTNSVGIQLEGDGNIVRNCKIESSGNAAVVMAGPNSQIVNNEIRLKEPFIPTELANEGDWLFLLPRLYEARKKTRAVIALRQASGALISGNRIEIEGASSTRLAILIRDKSKGVNIENNVFVGTDEPVTLWEGSIAELKNNTIHEMR